MVGPIYMGRGRSTGNSAVTDHGYIGVYLELDPPTKHYHLVEL